jgi:hypothetical protein
VIEFLASLLLEGLYDLFIALLWKTAHITDLKLNGD